MKILFIYYEDPNEPVSPPIGVGLLSAVLKAAGHEVKGLYIQSNLNCTKALDKITNDVRKYYPELICYSTTSPAFEYIKKIAQYLRKQFEITAICGGIHPTLYPQDVLSVEGIDYICVGEGERVLVEFVEKLKNKQDCSTIPGIWTVHPKKGILKNRLYPLNQNLDELPWVDYEVFGKNLIKEATSDGWLRYITSRGCPYSCTYCHNRLIKEAYSEGIGISANMLGYIRFKSVDSCILEIEHLVHKYNLRVINFMDDLFGLKRSRTEEFCRKFKESLPPEVGFSIQTHLEHLDRDLIELLRDSRCLRVVVGVESGSQRILKLYKRVGDYKKMSGKLCFLVANKFPLGTWTLNMLGAPTETKEEMLATLAINANCGVERVKFNITAPYPGSEIYDYCKNNNLLESDSEVQRFEDRFFSPRIKYALKEKAFLEKFFDIGHWYMNLYLSADIGNYYKPLINEVEKIGVGDWQKVKSRYKRIDAQLSRKLSSEGRRYYNFMYQGKVYGKVVGLT